MSNREKEIARNVLKTFEHKSPLELEALATMDYVANFTLSGNPTEEDIIEKFEQIKGTKFNKNVINSTLEELKELELILFA